MVRTNWDGRDGSWTPTEKREGTQRTVGIPDGFLFFCLDLRLSLAILDCWDG